MTTTFSTITPEQHRRAIQLVKKGRASARKAEECIGSLMKLLGEPAPGNGFCAGAIATIPPTERNAARAVEEVMRRVGVRVKR